MGLGLILDDREDALLRRLIASHDVPVTVARLEYGDACWEGYGPHGLAMVGVERKRLSDVVTSMTDRRLSGHQLRGMWQTYDYNYLVIEDIWRPGEVGEIEVMRGGGFKPLYAHDGAGCTYRQVQAYLTTLEAVGDIKVIRSGSQRETAAIYAAKLHWWQKKWTEHRSHDEIYAPGPEAAKGKGKASFVVREAGLTERIAAQLPGIDRKAWDIGKIFRTPREFAEFMALANAREWEQIRGIGKDGAKLLADAMDEEAKG